MAEVMNIKMDGSAGIDVCAEFDGVNQNLNAPEDSDFDITTNWTCEAWVRPTAVADEDVLMTYYKNTNDYWWFEIASNTLRFVLRIGDVALVDFTATAGTLTNQNGTWMHLAVIRNEVAGSYYWGLYKNGVQVGYVADDDVDTVPSTATFYVGQWGGSGRNFRGSMRGARIHKTNVYNAVPNVGLTDSFPCPTVMHVSDASTAILLKMDEAVTTEAYTDSGPGGHIITNANNVVQNYKQNYLNASWLTDSASATRMALPVADAHANNPAIVNRRQAYFLDGDSDWISFPDSADWDIAGAVGSAAEDFTVDMWVKHIDHAGTETYLCQFEDTNNEWYFNHVHGTGLGFHFDGSTGINQIQLTGGEITDDEWHHVALIKVWDGDSTEWGLYLDGVQTAFVSDESVDTLAGSLFVGQRNGGELFDGHVKNIRIINSNIFNAAPVVGVDDIIEIPTADPSSDSDTKLLLNCRTQGLNSPLCSTALFDGTNDSYLSVPDHADWDFAEGAAFTVEGWFQMTVKQASDFVGNTRADGWLMHYDNTNLEFWADGTSEAHVVFPFIVGRWYHVAMTRTATTGDIKFWVDGTEYDTGSQFPDAIASASALTIGVDTGTEFPFEGYAKEIRVSDVERYTSAFTPATSPLIDDANTLLLLHLNGVPDDDDNTNGWLLDSSTGGAGSPHTVTRNADVLCKYIEDYRRNTVVDSGPTAHVGTMVATAKLAWMCVGGNGALDCDGALDFARIPDSADFALASNPFTISVWTNWDVIATERPVFSQSNTAAPAQDANNSMGLRVRFNAVANLEWMVYDGGANTVLINAAHGMTIGNWYYLTIIRGWSGNNNDWALLVNGSVIGTLLADASAIPNFTNTFNIGYGSRAANKYFDGLIDEFYINQGVADNIIPFIPPVYPTAGGSGNAFQAIMF